VTQEADSWVKLPPATFVLDGVTHTFTAQLVTVNGSNRLARRNRPFQDGAKVDFVGNNADELELECIFHPDVTEPGADFERWPTALEDFEEALRTGKTGTLNLPWKRGLRMKGDTWARTARADENRGGEIVRVKFLRDNEDSLDREAMQRVSVRSTINGAVEAAQFDLESEGGWNAGIEQVTTLAAQVQSLLATPGDTLDSLLHVANRLRRAVESTAAALEAGPLAADPEGSSVRQKLLELAELAARAEGEALAARPKTRTFIPERDTTIFRIATELGQKARELMSINGAIEDFNAIPAGTPVTVFV
jgi:hypothetical protein